MILGFAGKIGVGKTETAKCLVRGNNFVKFAFGQPIKDALVQLTGLPMIYFTDPVLKEKEIEGLPGISPRIMMQKLGTDYAREMIFHDFFCWRMGQNFINNSDRDIVIDDVRFDNEAEFIRKRGGKIIQLLRIFKSPTKEQDHVSENGIVLKPEDMEVLCMKTPEKTAEYILTLI